MGQVGVTQSVLKVARASLNKFTETKVEEVLTSCCECLKGLNTMGREITRWRTVSAQDQMNII